MKEKDKVDRIGELLSSSLFLFNFANVPLMLEIFNNVYFLRSTTLTLFYFNKTPFTIV